MKTSKIAFINLSGNVGKSTLATHWLASQRPTAKFISVENANASVATEISSLSAEEYSASQFRSIFRDLAMNPEVIIDVGASNVTEFMDELTKYPSAVRELDLIIVPTVPDGKQQKDTVRTIEWLNDLGFTADKIRVVYNMHSSKGRIPLEETYDVITGYAATYGKNKATFNPPIVIRRNEVFDLVRKLNVRELAEDKTDYAKKRAEAYAAGDTDAAEAAFEAEADRDVALTAQKNLAEATEMLFGKTKK